MVAITEDLNQVRKLTNIFLQAIADFQREMDLAICPHCETQRILRENTVAYYRNRKISWQRSLPSAIKTLRGQWLCLVHRPRHDCVFLLDHMEMPTADPPYIAILVYKKFRYGSEIREAAMPVRIGIFADTKIKIMETSLFKNIHQKNRA